MKRLTFYGIALAVLAALVLSSNYLVARALDAQLAKLLSRELGIEVTLGPTRARIPSLTVHSPSLVMGDPARPALVASGVSVSLDWSDLLRGEIRLRRATGEHLMVNTSLWPGNDNPWPTDYRFIDPYLPDYLALQSASYVDADGVSYAFSEPLWRREPPGATLNWHSDLDGQAVAMSVALSSLDELLRLAQMKLQITATAPDKPESAVDISLGVQPGEHGGYTLNADISASGMTGQLKAASTSAWKLPEQSSTSIGQLDIQKLRTLLAAYDADEADKDAAKLLDSTLPRLSLPVHTGKVTIEEIRWQDEVGTDSVLEFTTGPTGVVIPGLSSKGPEGVLHGDLNIASSERGWQLDINAKLESAGTGRSLAAPYLDADWFWREGNAKITGDGDTWGTLLNSLQGDIDLNGSHQGATETPVAISAILDHRPGQFTLDKIEVALGRGKITGSATLSGEQHRQLSATVSAGQVNLDFLLPEKRPEAAPGIAVPTYLGVLPGIDLDLQLDVNDLSVGTATIASGKLSFTRGPQTANLTALIGGTEKQVLKLELNATTLPNEPSEVTLRTELSQFSFAELFRQASPLPDTRTSGTVLFSSRGNGVEQIFEAMRGKARLSLDHRHDQNWARPAIPGQQLQLSGEARLVLAKNRITGLQISDLALDGSSQNLTGEVSIVEGRKPWLQADLTSEKLDLDSLASQRAGKDGVGSTEDSLNSLKDLGDSLVTLKAKSLLAAGISLGDVDLEVTTAPNSVQVKRLNFSLQQGSVVSHGGLSWLKDEASLSLDATVQDISLDKLLDDVPKAVSLPLSGTVSLHSSGGSAASLLANLSGDVELTADPAGGSTTAGSPARIAMTARQTANGMHADIRHFQWEGSDLAGSIHYQRTTPPLLEVQISGGSLSLLPFEASDEDKTSDKNGKKDDGSIVSRTAEAGANLISDVVMTPLRLLSGPREAKPGDKIFSNTALPLQWLLQYQARFKGKLDELVSREGSASDLEFSGSLLGGKLIAEASAGALNKGSASAKISIDANQQPRAVALSGTFSGLRGDLIKAGFPRSGYFDIDSRGDSQAELAGNANGMVYLELGAGPLDFGDMMLLTADVATAVFSTLIPGADKKKPQLECAVTLGVFKDGVGTTPYGYAARTNQANLVGRVDLDLRKELIHLNFSSSSRQGVGFSIGNVFSNTVEVEGPISDPKVIPNATGLLWRSWAAVMTGGLSIVGESVLKRALASENPCETVQKHIRKDLCGSGQPAASSPMVCPPAM